MDVVSHCFVILHLSFLPHPTIKIQYIFQNGTYPKPLFTTYFETSLFSIYLVAFIFWRPWQRACCPVLCKKKLTSSSTISTSIQVRCTMLTFDFYHICHQFCTYTVLVLVCLVLVSHYLSICKLIVLRGMKSFGDAALDKHFNILVTKVHTCTHAMWTLSLGMTCSFIQPKLFLHPC